MDKQHKIIISHVLDFLDSEDFKDSFIQELNDEIDIPFINEKKEGKLFKTLYKTLIKSVRQKLED